MKTENMKNISINKIKTLASAGIENVIVYKMACRLFALPASLSILVTLAILKTLAIFGNIERAWFPSKSRLPSMKSNMDAETTKKSNLFQEFWK